MPLSLAAGLFLAATAVGGAVAYEGIQQQTEATKNMAAEQAKQEQIRAEAARLEAERKRREVFRQAYIARSTAISRANAQGAGQSSALEGGLGGIQGQEGKQFTTINTNEAFGQQLYQSNIALAGFGADKASGQSTQALGGMIMNSAQAISNIGSTAGGWFNNSNYNPNQASPQKYADWFDGTTTSVG